MIRGATQTFKIKIPCRNTELDWVKVYFNQSNNPNRNLPIIKTLEDCGNRDRNNNLDGTNNLYVSLTSAETRQFSDRYKAKMHFLGKPRDGGEFALSEYLITVYSMPDEVIEANIDLIVLDGQEIIPNDDHALFVRDGGTI
jgi:hypothetical protein